MLDDDISEYLKAGADMILPKPVKAHPLKLLLQHVRLWGGASQPGMRLTMDETSQSLMWVPEK